jgi:hypothetical protein
MDKTSDLILRIIAWSLLLIGFIFLLLMATGVISSPEETLLNTLIVAGVLLEIGRLESRVSVLWKDFEKRKRI